MSKEYTNPIFQRSGATIPYTPVETDSFRSDEKTALILDVSGDIQNKPKKPFLQRHFWKIVIFGICLLVLILILAIAVPKGIEALMGKYLKEAKIEIVEMEVTNIVNGTAYIRIEGSMTVDAPVEVDGSVADSYIDLLIADPMDRSTLAKIGTVFLPAMAVRGKTVYLNVSTTLTLVSDRLFHAFINDVLYNQTVTSYMRGDVTLTAKIPVYGNLKVQEELFTPVTIDGMNGLDFILLRIDLLSSTNDSLSLIFDLIIKNPSQFYSTFPLPLYFMNIRLYFNDTFIGFLEPQDLLIGKNESFNTAIGSLIRTPTNEPAIAKFLSDYIMGFDVPIVVNGSTKVDVGLERNPDFPAQIYVDWVMPGIESDLIKDLFSDLTDFNPRPPIVVIAVALLQNPLEFDIEVLLVEFDGYVGNPCNRTVARILETYYDVPLLVQPNLPLCVPLDMQVSLADALCILEGISDPNGLVLYAQNGVLEVKIDQFIISVNFEYGPLYATLGPCNQTVSAF